MDRSFSARAADGSPKNERVAVEEPLQITLDGCPIAVVMRTPGHDLDLVRGFLVTEGILPSLTGIRRIDDEAVPNHLRVFLSDEAAFDPTRLQRHLFSASSCGICGKASIDRIVADFPPIPHPPRFPPSALLQAPDRLRAAQTTFATTGGLHGVGLFEASGSLLACREDIGRHNAVDKLIGHALAHELPLAESFLLVSGRVSFEIMQKALGARIPLVAAISAPSSLAIEFAQASGQSLVGFLRPPRFNVYAGELRD
ncbi:FdhD protein [Haloferula luteola]|uniref:Sulfur carrier protein FdhD n=1 Tax=Haloferula luteola TaxID=595692 RepID=A0A840VDR0_9BACT|nr:formate dehydrogenase accessory sulfurtransferase FdhD [Haloferula luteola]MBB5352768.1 FdhD protein [Haloferula luteola]